MRTYLALLLAVLAITRSSLGQTNTNWGLVFATLNYRVVAVDRAGKVYSVQDSKPLSPLTFSLTKRDTSTKTVLWSHNFSARMDVEFSQAALDPSGNIYVLGTTYTPEFSYTNYLSPHCSPEPCQDYFLTKLSPDGTVIFTTRVAPSIDMTVDSAGTPILLNSNNWHYSPVKIQKVDPSGSVVSAERPFPSGRKLTSDSDGNVFLTGACENDVPLTSSRTLICTTFLAKFSPQLTDLLYSVSLGSDQVSSLVADKKGYVVIAGNGINPATQRLGNCCTQYGAYIAHIDPNGNLVTSTILSAGVQAIAVDEEDNLYITGGAGEHALPLVNPIHKGPIGAIAAKFDSSGKILFSTYLGGEPADSIFLDPNGGFYISGHASSYDFPVVGDRTTARTVSSFAAHLAPSNTPVLSISPGVDLFYVPLHVSTGTIRNVSTLPLNIVSITTDSGQKVITNCPTTLPPAEMCNLGAAANARITVTAADNPPAKFDLLYSQSSGDIHPAFSPAAGTQFPIMAIGSSSEPSRFTVTNISPFDIDTGYSSPVDTGDFSESSNCGPRLLSGASCYFDFVFHPTSAGYLGTGHVFPNEFPNYVDGGVRVSGFGSTDNLHHYPEVVSFLTAPAFQDSLPQILTLTNVSRTPIAFKSIDISGDFWQTNDCPASLTPSASCGIVVRMNAQSNGPRSGDLTISHSGAITPTVVGLGGIAVVLSDLKLSTFDLNVGGVVGGSYAQSVTVTNGGAESLSITGLELPSWVTQTNNCPTSLAPAQACEITVRFTPTAVGAQSGLIRIFHSGNSYPQVVNLVAAGGYGMIAEAPDNFSNNNIKPIDFGTKNVGQELGWPVYVRNVSNTPIELSISISGEFVFDRRYCPATLTVFNMNYCSLPIYVSSRTAGKKTGTLTITSGTYPYILTIPLIATLQDVVSTPTRPGRTTRTQPQVPSSTKITPLTKAPPAPAPTRPISFIRTYSLSSPSPLLFAVPEPPNPSEACDKPNKKRAKNKGKSDDTD